MKINNVAQLSNLKSFKGTQNQKSKMRYKHYEQMSDEFLQVHSVLKAHKDVEKSAKMRFFKSIPMLTTLALGTSLAITQPGKLSAKAATGLGFLALSGGVSKISKISEEIANKSTNNKKNRKNVLIEVGSFVAMSAIGIAGLMLAKKSGKKVFKKIAKPAYDFLNKEKTQLINEINSSSLAKFIDKTEKKNSKALKIAKYISPIGILGLSALTQLNTADSLSKDIKEKTISNYKKGKAIQKIAKEHFDSIDAKEV